MTLASRAFEPPFHIPFVRQKLAQPGHTPARQPGDDYAIADQRDEEIAAALEAAKPAAVLIGLIERPHGTTVLLTERATHLRSHSGQVAFPGGKIDPGEDALEAALREAHEEIGLERRHIDVFGALDPYLSGSGYRITPIVAEIHPPFDLEINHEEVAETFEAPFAFVMAVSYTHLSRPASTASTSPRRSTMSRVAKARERPSRPTRSPPRTRRSAVARPKASARSTFGSRARSDTKPMEGDRSIQSHSVCDASHSRSRT